VTDAFLTAERDLTSDLDLLPVLGSLVFAIAQAVCMYLRKKTDTRRWGMGASKRCSRWMFLGRGWEEKKIEAVGKRSSYQNEFFLCASLSWCGAKRCSPQKWIVAW
jgi:hypothetical protein